MHRYVSAETGDLGVTEHAARHVPVPRAAAESQGRGCLDPARRAELGIRWHNEFDGDFGQNGPKTAANVLKSQKLRRIG